MKPCTRVGLDITWKCNWKCGHCFYFRNPNLHRAESPPLKEVTDKIDRAARGGLDHAVMVGYGEPSIEPNLQVILEKCHDRGLSTSLITNGASGPERFKTIMAMGVDHLHISSHGMGDVLDGVVGVKGAFQKQTELKDWLTTESIPFRTNVTMQQANYRQLPELAKWEVSRGVFHFVFLGFLPHYEWAGHVNEVAVHPAELRPHIEEAADILLDAGVLFTIRYHPLCHLSEKYWPYVVNARYVYFDPWEWNYELQVHDVPSLWEASKRLGDSVACRSPCIACTAYRHCGGWNVRCAAAFDGAGLKAIESPPDRYASVWAADGGLHDLNPANDHSGTICRERDANQGDTTASC